MNIKRLVAVIDASEVDDGQSQSKLDRPRLGRIDLLVRCRRRLSRRTCRRRDSEGEQSDRRSEDMIGMNCEPCSSAIIPCVTEAGCFALHAKSFLITRPPTSVRRSSRPLCRNVSCLWSRPIKCRIVA